MPLMDGEASQDGAPEEAQGTQAFHNPLLAKAEAAIEAKLTPQNRANYMKIVVAGMKIVTAGGPTGLITKLTQSKDPIATATAAPINLILIMRRSMKPSQGRMPETAMVPAATTLMLHALDVLDKMGIVKVDEQVLGEAFKKFADNVFRAFNITNEQIKQYSERAQQALTSPGGVERLHQHAQQVMQGDGTAPPQPPAGPTPGAPAPLMNGR